MLQATRVWVSAHPAPIIGRMPRLSPIALSLVTVVTGIHTDDHDVCVSLASTLRVQGSQDCLPYLLDPDGLGIKMTMGKNDTRLITYPI